MSWPIDGEGTIRYSTGRPGRENAPAVALSPVIPTIAGSNSAALVAPRRRRAQRSRIPLTNIGEFPFSSVTRVAHWVDQRIQFPNSVEHVAGVSRKPQYRAHTRLLDSMPS